MAGTKPYMGECSRPLRPQSSSPATSHPSLTLPPTPTPDPSHALSRLWPLPSRLPCQKDLLLCFLENAYSVRKVGLVQFNSVTQSCPTLCNPMNRSTPGLPIHHQLPEFTQTHVHWVGDAIQPSHPLSSPSPPALSLSQHQGLFKWVSSLPQVAQYWSFSSASVLPMNTQDWSPLEWTGWISLQSKGLSRVFSNTTAQKHQFFSAQLSL